MFALTFFQLEPQRFNQSFQLFAFFIRSYAFQSRRLAFEMLQLQRRGVNQLALLENLRLQSVLLFAQVFALHHRPI